MPSLAESPTNSVCKMLLAGNSGSGKTGSLASLAEAGYNLYIIDFDRGLDYLSLNLSSKAKERVSYVGCFDKFFTQNGRPMVRPPVKAFATSLNALDKWPDDGVPATKRTPNDVIVIDSLTFQGNAAMRSVLALNNRLNQSPYQSDWGEAMGFQEDVLSLLYDPSINCNVIVTSHIVPLETPETYQNKDKPSEFEWFPSALGRKLPPKIPTYFNTMVVARARGVGQSAKRVICTVPQPNFPTKVPAKGLPSELPIQDGLAVLFKAITGRTPKEKTSE